MIADVLTCEDDPQDGEALLELCLRSGKRLVPSPPLVEVRQRAATQLAHLPEHLQKLQVDAPYPVTVAPTLRHLASEVDRQFA